MREQLPLDYHDANNPRHPQTNGTSNVLYHNGDYGQIATGYRSSVFWYGRTLPGTNSYRHNYYPTRRNMQVFYPLNSPNYSIEALPQPRHVAKGYPCHVAQ
ncbi:hypothetical protein ACH5RR_027782 [Cinchona calisaya]|uniref:Uncharacterized protein n=1 Tax=Cinchona calisaya TaxID=153742 RepID=A0ABD2YN92_9GENT